MAKVKDIFCEIYKCTVTIFIGSPNQFKEWCECKFDNTEDSLDFKQSVKSCAYGIADFHYTDDVGIVRLPKFPHTKEEIAYTAHELLHATMWVLDRSGVEFNNASVKNEAYTYLLEYLMLLTLDNKDYTEGQKRALIETRKAVNKM